MMNQMNARSNRPPHRCIGLQQLPQGLAWVDVLKG